MVGKGLHPMMPFKMFLHPLQKMHTFMFCGTKPTFFSCVFFINELTLFYHLMAFSHWLMLSLLTPLEQTWYFNKRFLVGGYDNGDLGEGKTLLWPLPNICYFSSHHRGFWMFWPTIRQLFHQCVNMAWTTKNIGGLLLSVLCFFYRQKMLVDLQRSQAGSILNCDITVGEGFF